MMSVAENSADTTTATYFVGLRHRSPYWGILVARPTEEMLAFGCENGIVIQFRRQAVRGLYLRAPGMSPHISLNSALVRAPVALRAVLAECLGLHFTRIGRDVRAVSTYRDDDRYVRLDAAAMAWAIDYMMDGAELSGLWVAGKPMDELAKHFAVPPGWVLARLRQIGISPERDIIAALQ